MAGTTRQGRYSPRWWILLAAAVLILSTGHRLRDFVRIDGCLDRGAVFDYAAEQCLTGPAAPLHLPTRSYEDRHPVLARVSTIGPWLAFAALATATVLAMRKPGPVPRSDMANGAVER
jgi:hypothetical protein